MRDGLALPQPDTTAKKYNLRNTAVSWKLTLLPLEGSGKDAFSLRLCYDFHFAAFKAAHIQAGPLEFARAVRDAYLRMFTGLPSQPDTVSADACIMFVCLCFVSSS